MAEATPRLQAESPPGPVAWVSLDEDDYDPSRFWSRVLASLRASAALERGSPVLDLTPRPAVRQLLTAAAGRPGAAGAPVVIVLDDLHRLSDPAVTAGLAAMLRHAGPPTGSSF